MTATCVVSRGDVLELLDDVREALPGELDDAQDVLDRRDEIVGNAEHQAQQTVSKANLEAEQTLKTVYPVETQPQWRAVRVCRLSIRRPGRRGGGDQHSVERK